MPNNRNRNANTSQEPNSKKYADVGNWPAWKRGDQGATQGRHCASNSTSDEVGQQGKRKVRE